MKFVNYDITLDVHETSPQAVIHSVQGNTACVLNILLTESGKPYVFEEGCYVDFKGVKPDDNKIYNPCVIDEGLVRYYFTEQTVILPGVVKCELRVADEEGRELYSPKFDIILEKRLFNDDEIVVESKSESLTLKEFEALVNTAIEETKEAQEAAEAATATAIKAQEAAGEAAKKAEAATTGTVRYDIAQTLNLTQAARALANIRGMGFRRLLTSADDMDDIKGAGVYYYTTADPPANAPFPNAAIIEAIETGEISTRIIHRATRYGTAGQKRERVLYSDVWSGWVDIFTSESVIPIINGGTGAETARGAEYNISKDMEELLTDMNDDTMYVCRRTTTASEKNGAFGYRTGGNLWSWIASKIRSLFGFSSSNVLSVANGGTGSTSKLAALRNLGVLESSFSPGGTACFYVGDIQDQSWYTDTTMTTYDFINGLPAKSLGIFAGNGKKLSDQPYSYCQMLVVKGINMNYANAIAWRISSATAPQFFTYSASSSSGSGSWGEK